MPIKRWLGFFSAGLLYYSNVLVTPEGRKRYISGLGLSMVHGITKNCGGTVILESNVGKGTSIYVYLPRTNSDQALKETKKGTVAQPAPIGAERILFIDDEPELVALSRQPV